MPDPNARILGAVHDLDGCRVPVGVDYDTVVIVGYKLDRDQVEELARLIVAASWEAAACGAEMASDDR